MTVRVVPLVLCLFLAAPAKAAPCDEVADLLVFAAEATGYPIPLICPEISRSSALSAAPALRSQVGAFVPETGQVLLAPDLDTDSILGRSYLLHELVHAAQYRAGRQAEVNCEAELESEAYRVQTAWLRRQGEFREAMLLDWAAEALGRCGAAMPMDY